MDNAQWAVGNDFFSYGITAAPGYVQFSNLIWQNWQILLTLHRAVFILRHAY
jgi:hypothetical protein